MSGPRVAGSGRDASFARRKRPLGRSLLGLLIGLVGALALPASAAAIDEFPVPPGSCPGGITAGPDGALWFTEEGTSRIGRMTASGGFAGEVTIPNSANPVPCSDPLFVPPLDQITVGSDNRLWFTEPRDNQIGSIDPSNPSTSLVEYGTANGLTPGAQPEGITRGPDGKIWFTEAGLGKIGRLDPAASPAITEYPNVALGGGPSDITAGPRRGALVHGGSRGQHPTDHDERPSQQPVPGNRGERSFRDHFWTRRALVHRVQHQHHRQDHDRRCRQ